jgi:hypothetical protein
MISVERLSGKSGLAAKLYAKILCHYPQDQELAKVQCGAQVLLLAQIKFGSIKTWNAALTDRHRRPSDDRIAANHGRSVGSLGERIGCQLQNQRVGMTKRMVRHESTIEAVKQLSVQLVVQLKMAERHERCSRMGYANTNWLATIKLAVMRFFCAGLVLAVLMFLFNPESRSAMLFLAMPLAVALWVAVSIAFSTVAKMLSLPMTWIIDLFPFITILGDPILWIAAKYKPNLLPVESFGLFNRPILYVLRGQSR